MLRMSAEGAGLFLLPFMAYVVLLLIQRRFPFVRDRWSNGHLARMTGVGLAFAILGLVALGLFGERHRGSYVPAHIENGRLVPGRME
jgi:hypothetical protein